MLLNTNICVLVSCNDYQLLDEQHVVLLKDKVFRQEKTCPTKEWSLNLF